MVLLLLSATPQEILSVPIGYSVTLLLHVNFRIFPQLYEERQQCFDGDGIVTGAPFLWNGHLNTLSSLHP